LDYITSKDKQYAKEDEGTTDLNDLGFGFEIIPDPDAAPSENDESGILVK
jgi:hypothetical protein